MHWHPWQTLMSINNRLKRLVRRLHLLQLATWGYELYRLIRRPHTYGALVAIWVNNKVLLVRMVLTVRTVQMAQLVLLVLKELLVQMELMVQMVQTVQLVQLVLPVLKVLLEQMG